MCNSLIFFALKKFKACVCVCVYHVPAYVEVREQPVGICSSTVWVLSITLKSSGLVMGGFLPLQPPGQLCTTSYKPDI